MSTTRPVPNAQAEADESTRAADSKTDADAIAIVGIGCRYADTRGPDEFWEILRSGRNTVRDAPQHRIDLGYDIPHFYDPRPRIPGKISSKKGGFLEHPELFDPIPFGIAPRDALTMEPQQRLMVEVTWDALEDAGIVPESIAGERVAVMLGYMAEDYSRERMGVIGEAASFRGHDVFTVGGMSHAVLSGRIAYLLGVMGPSLTLDTACSSSLIATHLACQSLRRGESKMAIAGGVNIFLGVEGNIALSRSGMLSPSGACRAFDASADGFVRAEGAGVVILRPLADAIADGNPIYAVIRGTGISSDGRDGGHMMAPGRHGQMQAMRDAYDQAGVAPSEIHYVEAHGTGTNIGDPVEIAALAEVMGPGRPADRPLLVASVKGNLGHTESASGIAGLIKAALSIHHRELPAQLHFETPNPNIPWDDVPIRVQATHSQWPYPERALVGVNSFGISGTNAHVVLEGAPEPIVSPPSEASTHRPLLLPISAHDANALHEMVEAHRDALREPNPSDPNALNDLAYTLGQRRSHRPHRLCVVASSTDEMRRELEAALENNSSASVQTGVASAVSAPKIVMIFPGQGSQWLGMGRALLEAEPVFASSIDRIDAAYREHVEWSLREMLETDATKESAELDWTKKLDVLQPVLVAMEIALADLWAAWGIRPDRVIGQSMGEIAAAHIAGALSLEDVALLACYRGQVVATVSGRGAMAVVALSRDVVDRTLAESDLNGRVEIAGLNSPTTTILSGDRDAIVSIVADYDARGIFARQLEVDFASHCFHMDPLKEAFRAGVQSICPKPAAIPFDSTVDQVEKTGLDLDADYWVRNLRQPVAFDQGLTRSIEAGGEVFIEVSPHPTLARATAEIAEGLGASVVHVASLQRGQNDQQSLMTSLGELFVQGVPVDWEALVPRGQFVATPLYAYQRKRFWFSERNRSHQFRPVHPLLGRRSESSIDPRLHSWDFILDGDSAGFMQDYRVDGQPGAPAALHLELALAVSEAMWPGASVAIRDLQLLRPLALGESARCQMQAVLRVDGEQAGELRISSREGESDDWILLATCFILGVARTSGASGRLDSPIASAASVASPVLARPRLDRDENLIVPSDFHFDSLERCGLSLGPKCRTLRELESEPVVDQASGSVFVGRMMLPRVSESEWYAFRAHPAILEGCFQLVGTLFETPAAVRVRSLGQISFAHELGSECWCRISDLGIDGNVVRANLEFFDREGEWIGQIDGLEAEAMAERSDQANSASADLHSLEWRAADLLLGQSTTRQVDRWIVISSSTEHAAGLAAELQKSGARFLFCEQTEDLEGLVRRMEIESAEPWGLVLLDWAEASTRSDQVGDGPRAFRVASWAGEIREHAVGAAEIWIATHVMNNLDVLSEPRPEDVPGETTSGLDRSWAAELGSRVARDVESIARCIAMQQCRLFDTDGSSGHEERLALVKLMGNGSADRQFLARGAALFVPRLIPLEASSAASLQAPRPVAVPAQGRNFRAVHTDREGLNCLELEEVEEPTLEDGTVVVEVSTAALCQLDVLTGLGLAREAGRGKDSVGIDYSGIVRAVSESSSDLRVGDRVFGIHMGAMSRRIVVPRALVVRQPDSFGSREAASLAFPFLVARYALEVVARLRAGERLLVLSAAGGVGQALIQIAQALGAEVSTTASTAQKRALLRGLGTRVLDLDSDPALASSGVFDVVVSALVGAPMHAMLARLAAGGRYIDLCPRSRFERPELGALKLAANRSVSSIDVAEMMRTEPTLVSSLLEQTADDAKSGRLQPIPTTLFPANEADRALRFMAQNRHIGRVCLNLEGASEAKILLVERPGTALAGHGSFCVTGGQSDIRRGIVDWLREQGAMVVAGFDENDETVDVDATREVGAETPVDGDHATARRRTWIHLEDEASSGLEELDSFLSASDCRRLLISVREPVVGDGDHDRVWETRLTVDRVAAFDAGVDVGNTDNTDNTTDSTDDADTASNADITTNGDASFIAENVERSSCLSVASDVDPARLHQLLSRMFGQGLLGGQLILMSDTELSTRLRDAPSPLLSELESGNESRRRSRLLRAEIISLAPAERRTTMNAFVCDSLAGVQGLSEEQRAALDMASPLDSLGLDSLMTMELFMGMGRDLELEITADWFAAGPTLSQIAIVLIERLEEAVTGGEQS